jgi:hypothetical protein
MPSIALSQFSPINRSESAFTHHQLPNMTIEKQQISNSNNNSNNGNHCNNNRNYQPQVQWYCSQSFNGNGDTVTVSWKDPYLLMGIYFSNRNSR